MKSKDLDLELLRAAKWVLRNTKYEFFPNNEWTGVEGFYVRGGEFGDARTPYAAMDRLSRVVSRINRQRKVDKRNEGS